MTPLSLEELAELSRSLGRPLRKTFHCHPVVLAALRQLSAPTVFRIVPPGFTLGIDIFEHEDMEFGAWEIREGDEVTDSGILRFEIEFRSNNDWLRSGPGNWLAE